MCELALNRDRIVRHEELLRAVWRSEKADVQYLRVYVGYLRKKLGAARIVSVAGKGYRFATE